MNNDAFEATFDIKLIDSLSFEIIGEPEFVVDNGLKSSFKLTDADITGMPDDTRDIDTLRCLLSDYFERFSGYAELEWKCDIKRDTFQRVLKHKNGINITYTLLAKFCVGAGLTEDETKELFELNGIILNPKSRYDYILLCEVGGKGTIEDYNNALEKYNYKGVLSAC